MLITFLSQDQCLLEVYEQGETIFAQSPEDDVDTPNNTAHGPVFEALHELSRVLAYLFGAFILILNKIWNMVGSPGPLTSKLTGSQIDNFQETNID